MNKKVLNSVQTKKVLVVSFLVDLTDVILGILVTIISGSVVMLSQAVEGAADLMSSGLLLYGLKVSKKKEDFNHPFGYGREAYFWTLISALIMLAVTSTLTMYFGIERIIKPHPLQNTSIAYLVLFFTIFTNGYALSLSLKRIIKNRSYKKFWTFFFQSSQIETKSAFVLDLMGTAASILGLIALLLFAYTGDTRFDGVGALLIGLVLALLSIILLLAVKDFLIGKSVSINTLEIIKKSVGKVDSVRSVQDLKATHMGPGNILINIEINAQDDLTTNQLEKVIDKVKDEIRKDLPSANHIQVELES